MALFDLYYSFLYNLNYICKAKNQSSLIVNMKQIHHISSQALSLETVEYALSSSLALSNESIERIEQCRTYLDDKLNESDVLFYGINTGFGSLCNIRISKEETEQLQSNLVQSHASGTGEEVPPEIVKLILLLKIQSLSYGYSGICLETVQRLIDFYNHDILPVIFQLGSLGASGDLAPLAHMSLPLLGLGEVYFQGKKQASADVLKSMGWAPVRLHSKEGLALLNGTQFSTAYGIWSLMQSKRLLHIANTCAALSIDAFNCRLSPFDSRLHEIRPHIGQISVAAFIRETLADSQLAQTQKNSVQDPYAFRCVPQVHGASFDTIQFVEQKLTIEMNAVTDNPNIFPDSDAILSGGNFHAQPVALPLDFLAIALAELGSICERRIYQLISGQRALPPFLTPRPGLNSGLMIPQYTAASIVSQNKQLCMPASVDSIVSCNGQEDHVSMAANAGTKLYRVVHNLERLLAIEFMTAAQAMEFRRPLKTATTLEQLLDNYRQKVAFLEDDRILSIDIAETIDFLKGLKIQ